MTTQDPPSLRDALILAGLDLLREGGMAGLTLRKAAARAGVSHAAPAWHFKGLPGLLTAIAARAFDTFAGQMERARDSGPDTPWDRLLGISTGYLDFAETNGGLFHLMFASPDIDRSDPDFTRAADRAYEILRESAAPFADPAHPHEIEVAVWSLVHGYAQLGFSHPQPKGKPFADIPAFERLLARLVGRPVED